MQNSIHSLGKRARRTFALLTSLQIMVLSAQEQQTPDGTGEGGILEILVMSVGIDTFPHYPSPDQRVTDGRSTAVPY